MSILYDIFVFFFPVKNMLVFATRCFSFGGISRIQTDFASTLIRKQVYASDDDPVLLAQ